MSGIEENPTEENASNSEAKEEKKDQDSKGRLSRRQSYSCSAFGIYIRWYLSPHNMLRTHEGKYIFPEDKKSDLWLLTI